VPVDPINPLAETISDVPSGGAPLARGTSIGRYLIVDTLGAGGMGVVYAAYDPELDRRVALKALHSAEGDSQGGGRGRLFREAQAMARLSHPNVVTVYDVIGEGEMVLVAMELVEGTSLRKWLEEGKRPWRAIVEAFAQAGKGLAAAHDAGIVHRDFKLDNVLRGVDGQVKVVDFGLARSAARRSVAPDGSAPASGSPGSRDLPMNVTLEGQVVGTPAYMPPDQLRGAPADARSDQFAYCVALYEALYGVVPFEGTTLLSLAQSMEADRVRPAPRETDVPGWLRAIVLRGLRADPAERFPTMQALLAALTRDPGAARRRALLGVAGAAIAGVVVLGVARDRRAEAGQCRAAAARVDATWNDAAKKGVHDAFVASGRPYAEATYDKVAHTLDDYAAAWSHQAGAACEDAARAPTVDGRAARRDECLGARLADLRALVGVFGRAGGETVDRAVQAARALPVVDACGAADPLGRTWPTDPALRAQAQALTAPMADAAALRAAGRYAEGAKLAATTADEADKIGFAPLSAEAALARAQLEEDAGDLKSAEEHYHRASVLAEAGVDARTATAAWLGLAHLASSRADYPAADRGYDHAQSWADRVSDDDALHAHLWLSRAERLADEGLFDDSRALAQKALATFERLGSDDATRALNDLGIVADQQGRYDEARDLYGRALARYERLLGPDHPAVARELNNLGLMAADQGRYDEALPALQRALQIRERALGASHPDTAISLYNLAIVENGASRYTDALAAAERSVAAVESSIGPTSPDMAFALGALGESLIGLDRPAEAVAPLERALAIRQHGAAPINLADTEADLGEALVQSKKDVARGRSLLEKARREFADASHPQRIAAIDAFLKTLPK
jgi:serine/threonine-protein kinase